VKHKLILVVLTFVAGCRGNVSSEAPIRVNPNMFQQERYDPQEPNPLFEDGRAMRPEVPGTVAVGQLNEDDHLHRGLKDGKPAVELPVPLDRKLLERGRERFNIYCAMCHDRAGTGDGIVVRKGMLPPPSYADPRLRAMPVGQLFQIITRGVRNMPSYAAQIPALDRWAIVAYVRALQVARGAKLPDVPPDVRSLKGWTQ
jgi:mono/diheme cytochrome c family protein